jgi:hypothetical protein
VSRSRGGRHACRSKEEASRIAAACPGVIEEAMIGVEEGGGRVKEGGDGALKKVEVCHGRAVATPTTSRRGSIVEVRGRAAVPSKSEAVPSKVEEASMQVDTQDEVRREVSERKQMLQPDTRRERKE